MSFGSFLPVLLLLYIILYDRSAFFVVLFLPLSTGGVAGQLDYAVGGPAAAAGGFNPAATMGYNDQSEFLDSRAEAKRAHAERMQHLRQVECMVCFCLVCI